MKEQLEQVAEFHRLRDIDYREKVSVPCLCKRLIRNAASKLATLADDLENSLDSYGELDVKALRLHLICEEVNELALALMDSDEVAAADALADLLYVTLGSAVAFSIPIDLVFAEVHRSNMTKGSGSKDDPRLRDKGESYEPPQIEAILRAHGVVK